MLQNKRANILQTLGSHFKILCARSVTCSKFRSEHSQFLGVHVRNIVTMATWPPEFVHPCYRHLVEDFGLGISHAAKDNIGTEMDQTFISGGFKPTVRRFGLLEAAQTFNSVANIVCCKGGWCAQIWDDKTDVVCIKQGNAEKYIEKFSENFHSST